jgi:hypothetical protein
MKARPWSHNAPGPSRQDCGAALIKRLALPFSEKGFKTEFRILETLGHVSDDAQSGHQALGRDRLRSTRSDCVVNLLNPI